MSVVVGHGYGPPGPAPVFQWEAEFLGLLNIYRERKPLRVLEVGTYHGGTLYHWLQNAQPGAVVVSVDSYAVGVDNRHLYDEWLPAGLGVRVVALEGDSRDPDVIAAARAFGPYNFVFVDAGHYYAEVAADWRNYRPLVATGGVIAFHDILPPSANHPEIEVARLWQEVKDEGYETIELVADRYADWGGIGVVYL